MLRIAYAVQALTTGLTAAALLAGAPLAAVYALASLTAIGLTLVRPIHDALVPALAPVDRVADARLAGQET